MRAHELTNTSTGTQKCERMQKNETRERERERMQSRGGCIRFSFFFSRLFSFLLSSDVSLTRFLLLCLVCSLECSQPLNLSRTSQYVEVVSERSQDSIDNSPRGYVKIGFRVYFKNGQNYSTFTVPVFDIF